MLTLIRGLLLGALLLTGGVQVASARETVDQRIEKLLPGSDLLLPEGEGPFPVVLQMHGCGGKKKLQGDWAPVARDAGWAVIVIDSYAFRGINTLQAYSTICTGMQLWGRERAGDLYAMMEWVRRQPWADPDRIVAAGWSHGGWTVLDAMALAPGEEAARETRLDGLAAEPMKGLVGSFLIYPYASVGCVARARGIRMDVPVQALVGTNDVVVGGRGLARGLERLRTPAQPLKVEILEGATHAFDEKEAADLRVRYDPVLKAKAQGMYADFLRNAATRRWRDAEPVVHAAAAGP